MYKYKTLEVEGRVIDMYIKRSTLDNIMQTTLISYITKFVSYLFGRHDPGFISFILQTLLSLYKIPGGAKTLKQNK